MEQKQTTIKDNYNLTRLFINKEKEIKVFVDDNFFIFKCPTIRQLYEDEEIAMTQAMLLKGLLDWQDNTNMKLDHQLDYFKLMVFELGQFKQYSELVQKFRNGLQKILPELEFNFKTKTMTVNGITITVEICDYVIYLLKLSCGEKVTQPLIFSSPEAREFFLKQKEYDEMIARAKNKKGGDGDSIIKSILLITYAFPSLTFDYLIDQTLAQIHWLSKSANGAVSYSYQEKIFAAGNVKKGSKLEFFIK